MVRELNLKHGDLKGSLIKLAESKNFSLGEVNEMRQLWMEAVAGCRDLRLDDLADISEFVVHELCLLEQHIRDAS
ncbi:hypothetical protein [Pseudoteredinibacter isoporae]|uniref:hypothetical protein n=1 Tax=Pseudoteredinibacter isoporae TaxID=570281 RepID=UPI003106B9BC